MDVDVKKDVLSELTEHFIKAMFINSKVRGLGVNPDIERGQVEYAMDSYMTAMTAWIAGVPENAPDAADFVNDFVVLEVERVKMEVEDA